MSELEMNTENELETLKIRADKMGITYHPNIGLASLKTKVEAKLNTVAEKDPTAPVNKSAAMSKAQYDKIKTTNSRKTAGALVRIMVTCMNPDKKKWPGEIFSVGSPKLGTFKKFVPFNSPEGYHVPQIILEMMQERKFSQYREEKRGRNTVTVSYLVPEFAINILPNLTTQEIKDLANQQAASGSLN